MKRAKDLDNLTYEVNGLKRRVEVLSEGLDNSNESNHARMGNIERNIRDLSDDVKKYERNTVTLKNRLDQTEKLMLTLKEESTK